MIRDSRQAMSQTRNIPPDLPLPVAGGRSGARGASVVELPGIPVVEPIVSTRGADLLAVSLMLVFTTAALTLSCMPIVTPELQSRFGFSGAQIGLLTSVFMGFYGFAGITAGVFASRFGGRLLAITCGCFVVGSALFALSSNLGGFLVARAIQGIGGGTVVPLCNPVISNSVSPDRLKRCWGFFGCGWGLGGLLALLVMPSVHQALGFRGVFSVAAALAFVVGLAALAQKAVRALPPRSAAVSARGMAVSLVAVCKNYRLLLLGLCGTALIATTVGITVWTPSFFSDHLAGGSALAVYLVAGLGAAQLVGNPVGALAMGKWGRLRVIAASLILMTAASVGIPLAPNIALATAFVLLVGFGSFVLFAPMMSYIPLVVKGPEQVGPAAGVHTVMSFAGSLVAPWLFGLVLDSGQRSMNAYLGGYLVLAAFSAAAAIGLAFFRPRRLASQA